MHALCTHTYSHACILHYNNVYEHAKKCMHATYFASAITSCDLCDAMCALIIICCDSKGNCKPDVFALDQYTPV